MVGGYLENLHELKMTFGIGVYAYCLIAEAVEQIIGQRAMLLRVASATKSLVVPA